MMYSGWPDAISFDCDLYDGETLVGTTTTAYVFSGVDDVQAPLEGDPIANVVYGGSASFNRDTRELSASDLCPNPTGTIPVGTSIDDAGVFQQFEFGEGSELVVPSQIVIHTPTLDMFSGIVLFFFAMVFFIWFFRRPYDTY